jgi:hypothetical protein
MCHAQDITGHIDIIDLIISIVDIIDAKESKMANVVRWIVEEKENDSGKVTYSQEFSSYDEALDIYNSLKVKREDTFVSIQKSEKKLLLEG